jgi:hypothetical protein
MYCRFLGHSATRFAVAFVLAAAVLAARGISRPSATADETQVTETLRTFFAAATADDLEQFHSTATPNFYAYDGGKRFDGDALLNLIKSLHQAGNVFVWTVNEPEVHISGNHAWITYVNRGSVKNATGSKDVTWLESAVLEKSDHWRICFLHSTRAAQ